MRKRHRPTTIIDKTNIFSLPSPTHPTMVFSTSMTWSSSFVVEFCAFEFFFFFESNSWFNLLLFGQRPRNSWFNYENRIDSKELKTWVYVFNFQRKNERVRWVMRKVVFNTVTRHIECNIPAFSIIFSKHQLQVKHNPWFVIRSLDSFLPTPSACRSLYVNLKHQ